MLDQNRGKPYSSFVGLQRNRNMNTNDLAKRVESLLAPPAFELPEITPISHWLSGDAAFSALKQAVDELAALAPEDHDVLIQAFNIAVREIRYLEPHTFLFRGVNQEGHDTAVVAHYSQVVAHVVYLPKQGPERVITGFSRQSEEGK
jgi:hypothetical protein